MNSGSTELVLAVKKGHTEIPSPTDQNTLFFTVPQETKVAHLHFYWRDIPNNIHPNIIMISTAT